MPAEDRISLAEARKQGKLKQFIKEHRRDPKGDADAFNRALESMAGKSKEAREASSQGGSDD